MELTLLLAVSAKLVITILVIAIIVYVSVVDVLVVKTAFVWEDVRTGLMFLPWKKNKDREKRQKYVFSVAVNFLYDFICNSLRIIFLQHL
jgi:hypothetical protein